MKQLAALDWLVIEHEKGDAIVADCVVIARDAAGWKPLFLVENETMEAVVLPLTPDRLALGKPPDAEIPDLKNYNLIASDCANTFLVGNRKLFSLEKALGALGGKLREQIGDLTRSALVSAIEEFVGKEPPSNTYPAPLRSNENVELLPKSYSVSFQGCADELTAQLAVDRMTPMLEAVTRIWPLPGLAGITFAQDYTTAIRELDRGELTGPLPEPSQGEDFVGIGMPITVLRANKLCTHLVFRGELVGDLCANDEASDFAWEAVLDLLASVAWRDILASRFTRRVLARDGSDHDRLIGSYADSVFETYFRARLRSPLVEDRSFECEKAADAVVLMFHCFSDARSSYAEHGDHGRLLDECANASGDLMNWMARLNGLRALKIGPRFPFSQLDNTLRVYGLSEWSVLFAADLDRFHCNLDQWFSFDELNFLLRHLERLLYAAGVFPDEIENGQTFVRVTYPWSPPT